MRPMRPRVRCIVYMYIHTHISRHSGKKTCISFGQPGCCCSRTVYYGICVRICSPAMPIDEEGEGERDLRISVYVLYIIYVYRRERPAPPRVITINSCDRCESRISQLTDLSLLFLSSACVVQYKSQYRAKKKKNRKRGLRRIAKSDITMPPATRTVKYVSDARVCIRIARRGQLQQQDDEKPSVSRSAIVIFVTIPIYVYTARRKRIRATRCSRCSASMHL